MDRARIVNAAVLEMTLRKLRIALESYPGNRRRARAVLESHFWYLDDSQDSTPLELAGVSERTAEALYNGGIMSVERLVEQTREQVLGVSGVGPDALQEVVRVLAGHGLGLREDG